VKIPKYLLAAIKLTRYATLDRYPGSGARTTEQKRRQAVRIAEKALRWAERHVAAE